MHFLIIVFCIFRNQEHASQVASAVQQSKFKHFGHDMVILHEHDIRKDKGAFSLLKTKAKKEVLQNELTDMVKAAPFTLPY
jgi:hypothetical protein